MFRVEWMRLVNWTGSVGSSEAVVEGEAEAADERAERKADVVEEGVSDALDLTAGFQADAEGASGLSNKGSKGTAG